MPIARPAASVTLEGFELRVLQIPLVSPFTTSFGTETVREVIIARALTADGRRLGRDRDRRRAAVLERVHAGRVGCRAPLADPRPARPADDRSRRGRRDARGPSSVTGWPKAGLELAVLDAALRADGRPLGEYLGAVHDRVPSGVSVGIQRDPAALVEVVRGYLDEGYVRIKIKIKPGRDIAETAAVRDAFGGIPLQVDANSAYTLADADTLAELDRFDLLLIEQPLQEDDLVDHATLARRLRTPVCLDESIVSEKAALDALALGAASVINIKAGRIGGYLEAVRIHDLCTDAGIPVWCGGMLETGIGRAANAALAALPGFTLPGDVSASNRFYVRDIVTEPAVLEDGHVRVPTGAGLGSRDRPDRARGLHRRARDRAPVGRRRRAVLDSPRRPHWLRLPSSSRAARARRSPRSRPLPQACPRVSRWSCSSCVPTSPSAERRCGSSTARTPTSSSTRLTFADDWFAGEAVRDRTSTIPAGRTVDLRFALPESACEDEPDAAARTSSVTLELESGATATAQVADPLGFTTLIHEKECLRHDLARVATLEWTSFTASAPPLPAELRLSIVPAGADATAELVDVQTTNLLQFAEEPRAVPACAARSPERMPPPRRRCRSSRSAATRTRSWRTSAARSSTSGSWSTGRREWSRWRHPRRCAARSSAGWPTGAGSDPAERWPAAIGWSDEHRRSRRPCRRARPTAPRSPAGRCGRGPCGTSPAVTSRSNSWGAVGRRRSCSPRSA